MARDIEIVVGAANAICLQPPGRYSLSPPGPPIRPARVLCTCALRFRLSRSCEMRSAADFAGDDCTRFDGIAPATFLPVKLSLQTYA